MIMHHPVDVRDFLSGEFIVSSASLSPELLSWALAHLDAEPSRVAVQAVTGDASARRYFRLRHEGGASVMLVDAPPDSQKNADFLSVRRLLADAEIRVPALQAVDLSRGYLLLEDLGDGLLLPRLDARNVDDWYARAGSVLLHFAALPLDSLDLPDYGSPLLLEELSRFSAWFCERLLGLTLSPAEQRLLHELDGLLVGSALAQPRVFVHRDFHSRNLMVLADDSLAVIDFQDAVVGPVSYDLVSLLRDCYLRWPEARVTTWALEHRDRLFAAGLLPQVDDRTWLRWLDWMGLQRHLKVLGTFARLSLRDDKHAYLEDLPRVLCHIEAVLQSHAGDEPAVARFQDWFVRRVLPSARRQHWWCEAGA